MKTQATPIQVPAGQHPLVLSIETASDDSREPCDCPACGLLERRSRRDITRCRMRRAIARLPSKDREILILCVAGRLRYEEVSSALSIPVATVRDRVRHAREELRSILFADFGKSERPDLESQPPDSDYKTQN